VSHDEYALALGQLWANIEKTNTEGVEIPEGSYIKKEKKGSREGKLLAY
jgi:hypothetical protein